VALSVLPPKLKTTIGGITKIAATNVRRISRRIAKAISSAIAATRNLSCSLAPLMIVTPDSEAVSRRARFLLAANTVRVAGRSLYGYALSADSQIDQI
jgi:hypothetical protein